METERAMAMTSDGASRVVLELPSLIWGLGFWGLFVVKRGNPGNEG